MSKSPKSDTMPSLEQDVEKQPLLALCLFLLFSYFGQSAAYADDFTPALDGPGVALEARFADIDRALFLELVRLAKFNVHFHLEAHRHQNWRAFSYPLGRESGTALTFAATLIDLKQQARGLDNPARISRNALKKAVVCGIVGNGVSGGSSALELAQNSWVVLTAKEKGYSPHRSIAFVKDIVANT